jgi:hypothetical protein
MSKPTTPPDFLASIPHVIEPHATVVWQGSAGDRRPYADLTGKLELIHHDALRSTFGDHERVAEGGDRVYTLHPSVPSFWSWSLKHRCASVEALCWSCDEYVISLSW